MNKYVIELGKDVKSVQSIIVTPYGNVYTHTEGISNLEELNSDYINEHYGSLQDDAYQRGYKDCETRYCSFDACPNRQAEYQRGLNDAWEAAKKIFGYEIDGGIPIDKVGRVFGYSEDATFCTADIIRHNTASEAIAKLKAYEEKQNDKIVVGDEFVIGTGERFVVLRVDENGEVDKYFDSDGRTYRMNVKYSSMKKTGRHFDIASILEEMRND